MSPIPTPRPRVAVPRLPFRKSASIDAEATPSDGRGGDAPATQPYAVQLGRVEADRLVAALDRRGAGSIAASPDRLRALLTTLASAGDLDGRPEVTVVRQPAALRAPETWAISIAGLSPAAATRIDAAIDRCRTEGTQRAR